MAKKKTTKTPAKGSGKTARKPKKPARKPRRGHYFISAPKGPTATTPYGMNYHAYDTSGTAIGQHVVFGHYPAEQPAGTFLNVPIPITAPQPAAGQFIRINNHGGSWNVPANAANPLYVANLNLAYLFVVWHLNSMGNTLQIETAIFRPQ